MPTAGSCRESRSGRGAWPLYAGGVRRVAWLFEAGEHQFELRDLLRGDVVNPNRAGDGDLDQRTIDVRGVRGVGGGGQHLSQGRRLARTRTTVGALDGGPGGLLGGLGGGLGDRRSLGGLRGRGGFGGRGGFAGLGGFGRLPWRRPRGSRRGRRRRAGCRSGTLCRGSRLGRSGDVRCGLRRGRHRRRGLRWHGVAAGAAAVALAAAASRVWRRPSSGHAIRPPACPCPATCANSCHQPWQADPPWCGERSLPARTWLTGGLLGVIDRKGQVGWVEVGLPDELRCGSKALVSPSWGDAGTGARQVLPNLHPTRTWIVLCGRRRCPCILGRRRSFGVALEASPSSVYGAALLMRLGS